MKSSIKRWTPSEVNRVARLIAEGKRPDQIAENLQGRTPAAISNLIYKEENLLKLYQSNRDKRTLRLPQRDRTAHGRPVKQSGKKLLKDVSEAEWDRFVSQPAKPHSLEEDRQRFLQGRVAEKSEKKIVVHFADLMSAISAVASVLTLAVVLLALMS